MPTNSLTTSADGINKLEAREAVINGLYDDSSGYGTYGVGHLVYPGDKYKSFLLDSAQSDKLCDSRVKSKWPGTTYEVKYLEREAIACKDYDQLKAKAKDKALDTIANRKFGKKYSDLTDAQKATADAAATDAVSQESQLLNQTTEDVFAKDLKPFEKAVNDGVTGVQLGQQEFDALVSFSFNVGAPAFTSSSLLKKINENKYRSGAAADREKAIKDIESSFLAWNKSGGKVVDGLTTRRQDEADQFLSQARDELKALQAPAKDKGAFLSLPKRNPTSDLALASIRGVRPTPPV